MRNLHEPPSPERIQELASAFRASRTLQSAVELGIFTELARGPLDAETLIERLRIHSRGARDFFDALVALKMLDREDNKYSNTRETDYYLDESKTTYIGGYQKFLGVQVYPAWGGLTQALRTGEPQTQTDDFFKFEYSDPNRLRMFLMGMNGTSMPSSIAVANKFPWKSYRTFIDIGTALGGLPVEVAKVHAHLTGGGFDLPLVTVLFNEYVASFGLSDRLRFYPGNFFTDELPRADVLSMGQILHDWNLEEKKMLLRKAYDALPGGGALIVIESLIDDDRRANASGLLASLNMLVVTPGGFDYTGADCIGWMKETGFSKAYVEHLAGPKYMIIGMK